jgi:hypothetical protein
MKNTLGYVICIAALGMVGCSADGGEGVEDDGTSTSSLAPVDEATIAKLNLPPGIKLAGALPTVKVAHLTAPGATPQDVHVGGGGGIWYYYSDWRFTGIFGRSGNYVDQLGFHGIHGDTPPRGGGGGGPRDIKCASGLRITGIKGAAGNYVDRLGPICGTATSTGVAIDEMGGSGGVQFTYPCPNNTWVVGWQLQAGNYVDGLTAYCGN